MNLEISHIRKSYRRKNVLKDISFTAQSGQCIGILGANGCGKSTLLSILAGIQTADGGSFTLDGHDLFAESDLRAALVGYVPQGTPLLEELTALDNLRLWYDKKTLADELEKGILAMLGVGDFLKTPVRKLSGGMKKRLSIGCALSRRPPVVLLDEPTAALDLSCKQDICAYLRTYKQSGGILLLTTHEESELSLCDAWYIMKDGVLVPFVYDGDMGKLVRSL